MLDFRKAVSCGIIVSMLAVPQLALAAPSHGPGRPSQSSSQEMRKPSPGRDGGHSMKPMPSKEGHRREGIHKTGGNKGPQGIRRPDGHRGPNGDIRRSGPPPRRDHGDRYRNHRRRGWGHYDGHPYHHGHHHRSMHGEDYAGIIAGIVIGAILADQ